MNVTKGPPNWRQTYCRAGVPNQSIAVY